MSDALLVPPSTRPGLTDREWQIAHRIAAGEGRKRIAARLGISVRTVDTHLQLMSAKVPGRGRRAIRIARLVLLAASTQPPDPPDPDLRILA